MMKIMENGFCIDKGHDNILAARAVIVNHVHTYTTDELPLVFTIEHEVTGKVIETHCFDLDHHTHQEGA